jgi:ABC-type transporter Mla subunit MlaD
MDSADPTQPTKRMLPPMADPKKFLGGENLEKLKGLLRDVESFASTVKDKGEKVEQTLERLDSFVTKFGQTIDHAAKVFSMNEVLFREMFKVMGKEMDSIMEGRDGRETR